MKYAVLTALTAGALYFALQPDLISQPGPRRQQAGPLPGGGFLLNSGWKLQPAGKQVPLDTLPIATALSKDGKHLLVLNAGSSAPSIIVLNAETMQETSRTPVPDAWLGLTFSPDGKSVFVGGGSRASVFEFSWADGKLTPARTFVIVPEEKRTPDHFIGDVAVSPDGRMVYAAGLHDNAVHVINLQSGRATERFVTGRRPYRILFHPDGKSFFVSSWADGSVYHHDAVSGNRLGLVRLGQHTTDMIWRARKPDEKNEQQARWTGRLFVTASNTNSVFAVGVSESKDMQRIETINVALTAGQPAGTTPSALAMSVDQSQLFVVCSDTNAVATVDISEARSTLQGFVPVGSYPTAVRVMSNGGLVVLNGKGAGKPEGSASVIDPIDEISLAQYTKTVMSNSPYRDEVMDGYLIPAGNPIPGRAGDPSPIQHVIYIVKDGESKLSPTDEKLGKDFVVFDNFYVNGDSRADGLNWSTAAIAPDYVQKLWPSTQSGRRKKSDFEGGEPAGLPPAGYLWSNAASAGVSVKSYGFWAPNTPNAGNAVQEFLKDVAGFEQSGTMPRLTMLRLTDESALGTIIEAVSKTKFWPSSAVFVAPSNAPAGTHRAPAFILSPFTRRDGLVDSTMYSTTSMLRTMELILGMRPMTVFDAASRPMWNAFSQKADVRPYQAAQR